MRMHEFMATNREEILSGALHSLKATYPDRSSHELFGDVPQFLDEMIDALRRTDAGEPVSCSLAAFASSSTSRRTSPSRATRRCCCPPSATSCRTPSSSPTPAAPCQSGPV